MEPICCDSRRVFNTQIMDESLLIQLPTEVVVVIWSFLDIKSLLRTSLVCKSFLDLSRDNMVWYNLSKIRHFADKEIIPSTTNWKLYFIEKYLLDKPNSVVFNKSIYPSVLKPRYRHTCSPVLPRKKRTENKEESGSNDDSAELIIVGGTGESREVTYGELFSINLEKKNPKQPITQSEIFAPLRALWNRNNTTQWSHNMSGNQYKATVSIKKMDTIEGKDPTFSSTRHTSCVINDKMWVFGGSCGFPPVKNNDLHCFDTEKKTWETIKNFNGNAPSPRSDHTAVAIGNKMFIFGGSDNEVTPQNDVYFFDTETLTWEKPLTRGTPPSPRSGHAAVAIGKHMYVYGGAQWDPSSSSWKNKSNEMIILDTEKMTWSCPQVTGQSPPVATFPAAFAYGNHIWILGGGRLEATYVSDTFHVFDTVTLTWSIPKFSGGFTAKDCASCCVVGNKVVLLGGFRGEPVNELQIIEMVWFQEWKKIESMLCEC